MRNARKGKKILIVGAGPTGLGAAWRLREAGVEDFAVFDRRPYAGGLSASPRDARGFTWDFGVHVTHSHYPYVDRLLDELLPDGYFVHERRAWIRCCGTDVPYPFQYNVRHLPPAAQWECVQGLLDLHTHGRRRAPRTFEEWILATAGAGIARHFLFPYNRKIWCVPPSEMGCAWLGDRVPATNLATVLEGIILAKDNVQWGPNHTFRFPRTGGTGAMWNALAARLQPGQLRLGAEVTAIDPRRRRLSLGDGSEHAYDALISTMPLPELARLCGLERIAKQARRLRHTRVAVVGVGLAGALPEALREKTWVYCPGEDSAFYRVTPFSPLSPAHVPRPGQGSLLCEIALPPDAPWTRRDFATEAVRGLRAEGLIGAGAKVAHTHVMVEPHGYPVPTRDRDAVLDRVQPELEKLGIYSRGRFGGWKYEAGNMDHCLMQGVEVVDGLLRGTPEETLPDPASVNRGAARPRT